MNWHLLIVLLLILVFLRWGVPALKFTVKWGAVALILRHFLRRTARTP